MFKFILHLLVNQNKMQESTLDLFCEHQDKKDADEFAMELEQKAAELEVTVDYYMMEFM
jgi:hypothetical protein